MTITEAFEYVKQSPMSIVRPEKCAYGFAMDSSGNIKTWGTFFPDYIILNWIVVDNEAFQKECDEMKKIIGFFPTNVYRPE